MNGKVFISGLSLFSVLGAGSLGTTYLATRETVADGLKKSGVKIFSADEKEDKLGNLFFVKKFSTSQNPITGLFLSKHSQKTSAKEVNEFFKSMFGDINQRSLSYNNSKTELTKEEKERAKKLRDFCVNSSSSPYKTIFSEDKELVEKIKSLCTIKIKDLFEIVSNSIRPFSFLFKDQYTIKVDVFESHLEARVKDLGDSSEEISDQKLAEIQKAKRENKGTDIGRSLAQGCKDSSEKYYSSPEDSLIKLMEKYCVVGALKSKKNSVK